MAPDDDDRHWFAGTIYFNREDLAHPASWAIVALPILVAVAIALSQRY